jgi:hypothetical protein
MVHRGIITPVYNEFYTPVPLCRDPVLTMKISIFMKTSLKRSFSFQTLLRVVFVRASFILRLAHGTSSRRPKSRRGGFLMEEYRTRFLLLLADIDQSKKVHRSPDATSHCIELKLNFSCGKVVQFFTVSTFCDLLY